MKTYTVKLPDGISCIYKDIARMNKKTVEECLAIILDRVTRTLIKKPEHDET